MASPIAHSLIGLAVGSIVQPRGVRNRPLWLAFSVAAANAPDFDIFVGLATGKINQFHHGASHSLVAMLAFATVVTFVSWRWWWPSSAVFAASALLFGSHLLVDFFCGPVHETGGTQLLWPFSHEYFRAPVALFTGIRHGGSQASVGDFFRELLSAGNLEALAIELFLTCPWLVLAWWVEMRRRDEALNPHTPFGDLPETTALTLRLEMLERRLARLQKIGLGLLIALPLVITALRQMPNDQLNANQLVLRDAQGQHRAVFMVRPNGRPMLLFYDVNGHKRLVMGVSDEEEPMLALLGHDEAARATLKLDRDDRATMGLYTGKTARAVFRILSDGAAGLAFFDEAGRAIQRLPEGPPTPANPDPSPPTDAGR